MDSISTGLLPVLAGASSLLITLVWIVGILLLIPKWATHRNRAMLGTIGFGILILVSLLNFASNLVIGQVGSVSNVANFFLIRTIVANLFFLVGWGFILAALVSEN